MRGAMSGLMCEVVESHILEHISEQQENLSKNELKLATELSLALKAFL